MNLDRPLVLIVDDHYDTCELYQLALPDEGLEVVVASTVEQAKQCVIQQRPDVIVTDLSMPGADGLDLTRWLRRTSASGAPVIALTAWAGPEHAERAREAGCTTVRVKPCLPSALAATIRAVLAAQGLEA
jgi:CheY-like chemotaxis protein